VELTNSCEVVPVQPVDATPLKLIALSEGGVHDRTEAKRAFCGAESPLRLPLININTTFAKSF
jgi:hypothetical protein